MINSDILGVCRVVSNMGLFIQSEQEGMVFGRYVGQEDGSVNLLHRRLTESGNNELYTCNVKQVQFGGGWRKGLVGPLHKCKITQFPKS